MWKCYIKHPVGVMVVRDQNTVFGQKKVKKKKKSIYAYIFFCHVSVVSSCNTS